MKVTVVICVCACLLGLVMASSSSNPAQVQFRNRNSSVQLSVTFEALTPQGLRLSIPNVEGLDLLVFHGKINLPLRKKDQGNLLWDLIRPPNNTLVYEFPDARLLIGDIINYWLRIQYNGVSLYSDSLSHVVKELKRATVLENTTTTSYSPRTTTVSSSWSTSHLTTTRPLSVTTERVETYSEPKKDCGCNDAFKDVWTQMNLTTRTLHTIEDNFFPLQNKLESLTETVEELISHMNIGTKLLLIGKLPGTTNPVEDVRLLLIEKLKLHDLSKSILQAEYIRNGIAFEVASSVDKLRILKRSKDILSNLPYQIIDAKAPDLDVRSVK